MKLKFLSFYTKYILIIFFILISIVKLFSIQEISKNRELPIEPDDTFIYFTQSFLSYEDNLRQKRTMQSARDIVTSIYEREKNSVIASKDIEYLQTIENFFVQTYFLYSKVFGFLYKYFYR